MGHASKLLLSARYGRTRTACEGSGDPPHFIVGFFGFYRFFQEGINMVTAIVLINAKRGQVQSTANNLAEIEGISEVYSVGGRFDLVAIIRVPSNEAMADLVTRQMAGMDSIAHTETLLAFQSFSKHDLESMFSIGN